MNTKKAIEEDNQQKKEQRFKDLERVPDDFSSSQICGFLIGLFTFFAIVLQYNNYEYLPFNKTFFVCLSLLIITWSLSILLVVKISSLKIVAYNIYYKHGDCEDFKKAKIRHFKYTKLVKGYFFIALLISTILGLLIVYTTYIAQYNKKRDIISIDMAQCNIEESYTGHGCIFYKNIKNNKFKIIVKPYVESSQSEKDHDGKDKNFKNGG